MADVRSCGRKRSAKNFARQLVGSNPIPLLLPCSVQEDPLWFVHKTQEASGGQETQQQVPCCRVRASEKPNKQFETVDGDCCSCGVGGSIITLQWQIRFPEAALCILYTELDPKTCEWKGDRRTCASTKHKRLLSCFHIFLRCKQNDTCKFPFAFPHRPPA